MKEKKKPKAIIREITAGDRTDKRQDKIQQRRDIIFRHIQMTGSAGPSELADLTGADRGTIYADLKSLADDSKIHKNKTGWKPGPAAHVAEEEK